jgi:hypothetical protein
MKNDLFYQVQEPFFVNILISASVSNGSYKIIQLIAKLRCTNRANGFKEIRRFKITCQVIIKIVIILCG